MTWPNVKIGELCLPTKQRDPRNEVNGSFRYIDISSIDRENKEIGETITIFGPDAPSRARKEVYAGDVLISTVRPNLNTIAIVPSFLHEQIASTGFTVLRADRKLLNEKFLFFWTQTATFINYLISQMKGAHYPAVSDKIIKESHLPLPALSEQRCIVEILYQADTLRKKRVEADNVAEKILPVLFHKMFGDPIQLMNSKSAIEIKNLPIDLKNGFACGDKDVSGGIPHLRMNNIDDLGLLNLDLVRRVPLEMDRQQYRLEERDVLFMSTNSEDKVGKSCVFYRPYESSFLFSNHILRLRSLDTDRMPPEYLSCFLHLLWQKGFFPSIAKRWVNQSTVTRNALENIRLYLPNENEQKKFSNTYLTVMKQRGERVKSKERIDILFDSIMHRAFSGDLTAKWREAHMKELLQEMQEQAKELKIK